MARRKPKQVCRIVYPLIIPNNRPGKVQPKALQFVPTVTLAEQPSQDEIHATLNEAFEYGRRSRRERGPRLETIRQDAAIARLRDQDPKKWPWKKLGSRFGISKSAAYKAYRRHYQQKVS